MKIYQDDNLVDKTLEVLLRKAGHMVVRPVDVGLSGKSDPRHLVHALGQGLVMLTADWEDFEDLHLLVMAAGGNHPGIITGRYDNDSTRDMSRSI